jgi:peroxiredoxin
MIAGFAVVWLAIFAGGWLGWQLLRQNGRLLLRLDELEQRQNELEFGEDEEPAGLAVGVEAPEFQLPALSGERKSLAQYRGQRVLLLFFNPGCGFCRELLPKLAAVQRSEMRDQKPEVGLLIVTAGDAEKNRLLFGEHQVDCPVLLQKEMEVAAAYKASGTPSGYLIDSEGKIASELALGGEALLKLLEDKPQIADLKPETAANGASRAERFGNRSLARSKIKRDGLKTGTPAPDFRLPRLDGRGELALSELRGRRVLLVFSSPGCGPCNTLSPELEKFHREHAELKVVMISKGEPKENRAKVRDFGLTFPVVLQQQWEISRRYAMFATPIAFLIDEVGIIMRDVAVGTDGVLALLAETGRWLEEHALAIT